MPDQCIWCGRPTHDSSVEHIIPEAIGCPPQLILPGTVVCTACNNGLAHLDRAVADEFDMLAFMAGVPRKGGGPPLVSSRGNVRGSFVNGTATLTYNMERHPVTAHDGARVAAFRGKPRDIAVAVAQRGGEMEVSGSVSFGFSPKFVRGLTKIALSSVAYFLGADYARSADFDAARRYVMGGVGTRHALLQSSGDSEYRNTVWPPFRDEEGRTAVSFRLARVEFLVDLSPGESALPNLEAKQLEQMGTQGWCVLPPRG
jgi:hypothetical protein